LQQLSGPSERKVRDSTKAKTADVEESEKQRLKQHSKAIKAARARAIAERQTKIQHKQKDLLAEGLDTEETNVKWLLAQSMVEDERARADKTEKKSASDGYIRFSSRRGTFNTITFSMVDDIPSILRGDGEPQEYPVKPVRVVVVFNIIPMLQQAVLFCL
jgi:hypothetical protein